MYKLDVTVSLTICRAQAPLIFDWFVILGIFKIRMEKKEWEILPQIMALIKKANTVKPV